MWLGQLQPKQYLTGLLALGVSRWNLRPLVPNLERQFQHGLAILAVSADSECLQREGRGQCPGLQDKRLEHRAAPQVRGDPAECICHAWQFLMFFEMF